MEDQLISFETAKLAYEKGYPVFNNSAKSNFYNRRTGTKIYFGRTGQQNENHLYGCPAQSLLQKWLREEYNFHIEIGMDYGPTYYVDVYQSDKRGMKKTCVYSNPAPVGIFRSYEEALEKGLQESLKLLR